MIRCSENNVLLRDFTIDDVPKKVEWINNPQNNTFLHYNIPLSITETEKWFLKKDHATRIDCVIEYGNIPVGLIGLLNIDTTNQKAEFYISMGEPGFKRRGIATQACTSMVQYAFQSLKLHKVYLNADAKNVAARRLYEKVGFHQEGYFKDELIADGKMLDRVRYAILNSDNLENAEL